MASETGVSPHLRSTLHPQTFTAGSHGSVRQAKPDHEGGQGLPYLQLYMFACVCVCVCLCVCVCVRVQGLIFSPVHPYEQVPTDLSDTPNPIMGVDRVFVQNADAFERAGMYGDPGTHPNSLHGYLARKK